jgi:hypothetical protein
MKKINILLVLLFIAMVLLVGCGEENTTDIVTTHMITTEELSTTNQIWESIINQEYVADNGWAGEGLFFYEEGNNKYCDYMLFGSGLPVVGLYKSEVTFVEENIMVISLPLLMATDYESTIIDVYSTEWVEIILVYEEDSISGNDLVFIDRDTNLRELAIDMGYME